MVEGSIVHSPLIGPHRLAHFKVICEIIAAFRAQKDFVRYGSTLLDFGTSSVTIIDTTWLETQSTVVLHNVNLLHTIH